MERADGRIRNAAVQRGYARRRKGHGRRNRERRDDDRRRWRLRGRCRRGEPGGQDEPCVHRWRRVARVPRRQRAAGCRRSRRSAVMQQPIFIANWKMHHGPRAAREFVAQFLRLYPRHSGRTVILCPPIISVEAVAMSLKERPEIGIGAQNISTEPKGAFTGECSASMAHEAGAAYVLVGHSERRHVFGEVSEQTALKCLRGFESGLLPILCVGETLAQREAGDAKKVVVDQLRVGLEKLSPEQIRKMLIAYEPVWAIGTGKTATPSDASTMHAVIHTRLGEIIGSDASGNAVLYGGSVNEGNARSLLGSPGVAGLLVGGASLDPAGWARICQA